MKNTLKSLRRALRPNIRPYSAAALKKLPRVIEYTGEFGPELVLFLSFCTWLSKAGLLKNRRIRTYTGMRSFYDDLDCLGVIEKSDARRWVKPHRRARWLPVKDEHSFDGAGRSAFHLYPDVRKKYGALPAPHAIDASSKPILVIHNKHNNEWNSGPVNHISLTALETIFARLGSDFTIVYIRHGMGSKHVGFSDDHNTTQPFDETELLERFPDVLTFDALYRSHQAADGTQDLNTFKNVLYSRCHHFISSQGGGAHQIAMFSGSLLTVLHRRGFEELWAYGDGYYGFMATVPPIRAICRSEEELASALPLFSNTTIVEGRVFIDPARSEILTKLSPWTIAARR